MNKCEKESIENLYGNAFDEKAMEILNKLSGLHGTKMPRLEERLVIIINTLINQFFWPVISKIGDTIPEDKTLTDDQIEEVAFRVLQRLMIDCSTALTQDLKQYDLQAYVEEIVEKVKSGK